MPFFILFVVTTLPMELWWSRVVLEWIYKIQERAPSKWFLKFWRPQNKWPAVFFNVFLFQRDRTCCEYLPGSVIVFFSTISSSSDWSNILSEWGIWQLLLYIFYVKGTEPAVTFLNLYYIIHLSRWELQQYTCCITFSMSVREENSWKKLSYLDKIKHTSTGLKLNCKTSKSHSIAQKPLQLSSRQWIYASSKTNGKVLENCPLVPSKSLVTFYPSTWLLTHAFTTQSNSNFHVLA